MQNKGMVTDRDAVALQVTRSELSSFADTVSSRYSSRNDWARAGRVVNAAIASLRSFSNGTSTAQETTNALNSAIAACDQATRSLSINSSDSGFIRDVSRLKSLFQKAKGQVSSIRHSADDETATDAVMNLFFMEHGNDEVKDYIV